MTSDYPCNVCRFQLTDLREEPCASCVDYLDYKNSGHRPIVEKADRIVDSPYTGSDDPDHGDDIERILRLLQFQLDRLNDHLSQIAGELHHIHEDGLTVRAFNGDIINHRRDRP